jgi:hypothetical protein
MKLTYGIWEGDPTLLAEYEDGRRRSPDGPPGILEEEGAGGGHKFNEEWRKLPKDSPRKGELAAKMRARYACVVAELSPEWSGVIASLDLLPKI